MWGGGGGGRRRIQRDLWNRISLDKGLRIRGIQIFGLGCNILVGRAK